MHISFYWFLLLSISESKELQLKQNPQSYLNRPFLKSQQYLDFFQSHFWSWYSIYSQNHFYKHQDDHSSNCLTIIFPKEEIINMMLHSLALSLLCLTHLYVSHLSMCSQRPLDSHFALLFIIGFCILWCLGWFGKTWSWLITKRQQEIVQDISSLCRGLMASLVSTTFPLRL